MNETSGFVNVEFPFKDVDLVLDRDLDESCNSSGDVTPVNTFYFYEYEQLATLWVLFGSIVVGNSAVLISLFFDKRRSSRFNYFIKHLALADLSVGFVSVLTDIIWKMTVEWNAGNFACKVIRYSQAVVTYSSTYLLVALTIDRCEAIRHPMNFFKSWRRAKLLVVTAWILSVFFSIPLLVLYEQKIVQNRVQCWIELFQPWQWQVYMILISLTVFFIPALIIVVCYSVIIFTIWSNSNIADSKNGKNSASSTVFVNEDVNCKRVSSRGLIPKAKVKTIKMTLIIVFVFIICWGPYVVFDLLQVFGYVKRTQKNIAVATFIQSLAPLNSAANPIIYCIFSSYICRNPRSSPFLQYLCKCCCRSKVGVKVSDATTSTVITHASSGRCINFHHLVRLDNLSNADKNLLRGKGTSLNTGAEG